MRVFKRENGVELVNRLTTELAELENNLIAANTKVANAQYQIELGDKAAKPILDIAIIEMNRAKAEFDRIKNVLNVAIQKNESELRAAREAELAAAWKEVKDLEPEMLRIAAEIEETQKNVCAKFFDLRKRAQRILEIVPKTDGTPRDIAPLGDMQLDAAYRLCLRRNGMAWARTTLLNENEIPTLSHTIQEAVAWAQKLGPYARK